MNYTVYYYEERDEWCLFNSQMELVKEVYAFSLFKKEENKKSSTIRQYIFSLKSLFDFLEYKGIEIEDFSISNLMEFRTWKLTPNEFRGENIYYLNQEPSIKPKTWDSILTAMIQYFLWLKMRGKPFVLDINFLKDEKKKIKKKM